MEQQFEAQVEEWGVVPLASFEDLSEVSPLGKGLVAGGLPVVEVALRGPHGVTAIRELVSRGDMEVGAGTVLTPQQVGEVAEAGASFIVTPGLDREVVGEAQRQGLPIVPGIATPTELQAAWRLGLTRVKLFPAGVLGGRALVKSYADVFREVRFMPSGGVSESNLTEYLELPSVFAVSGSWIAAKASEGAEAVEEAARRAKALIERGRG